MPFEVMAFAASAGVAQRELVADEAGEQRALAGDELREPARMGRAQLDARTRAVVEVEKR